MLSFRYGDLLMSTLMRMGNVPENVIFGIVQKWGIKTRMWQFQWQKRWSTMGFGATLFLDKLVVEVISDRLEIENEVEDMWARWTRSHEWEWLGIKLHVHKWMFILSYSFPLQLCASYSGVWFFRKWAKEESSTFKAKFPSTKIKWNELNQLFCRFPTKN